MWTRNTGVVSSIPSCATFKPPLVRKATENHLIKSTSLEKPQSPVSGFCYARNRVYNAPGSIAINKRLMAIHGKNDITNQDFATSMHVTIYSKMERRGEGDRDSQYYQLFEMVCSLDIF